MKSILILCCLISLLFFSNSSGKGTPIAGKTPMADRIVDGIQYINKGKSLLDLEEAPVVASIDPSDKSITLYIPSIAPPESLYIRFIPSSMFVATLSVSVVWDQKTGNYQYQYQISSDSNSISPINYFSLEWWNDYKQTYSPEGWSAHSLHPTLRSRRINYWSSYLLNQIQKGETLAGIGYQSYGPPVLTKYVIWGELKVLDVKGDNEWLGSIYSAISEKYRGIEGITIAAWVCPESIEPVDWFLRVSSSILKLKTSGYLDSRVQSEIYPSVYSLFDAFRLKENHTTEILEEQINSALAALAPYQNEMQPEAWAFISENLKYVLRHLDIVTFKEYP